ncbi:MAG TPA: ARMT1-like domain-containing protein, partial [Nitrospirota bacterium]|nr:ARMT1-like domain-containing protein [Nitrospirota bacterium]
MEEEARRLRPRTGSGIVKTELECLPCFFGQITRTLNYAGVNGDRGRSILLKAEKIIERASLDEVPARTTTLIHRILREETGVDPYKQVKDSYNRIALDRLTRLRRLAAEMPDRLEGSVRIAIAGNVIDFGIYESFDLDRSLSESFHLPLSSIDYNNFAQVAADARRILFLCDNAGEIVFDRVLIESLRERGKEVTAVVKGYPVINDATLDDASAAGLAECATVIDNGNDGIGTLLEACSQQFMEAYRSADLIISKGQANYETLVQEKDARTFFLFKVKCPVVARALNRENGDIV